MLKQGNEKCSAGPVVQRPQKTPNVLGFEELACEGRRTAGCRRQAIAACIPAFAG